MKTQNFFVTLLCIVLSVALTLGTLYVCPFDFLGQQGEKGDPGMQGEVGPQGAQGTPGKDGENGLTPFIGENGNWWIGETDTGIRAEGKDGAAANKGEDGKDGADGKDGVDGKDGLTPFIGENGNWWIGETDTGVRAEGKDGAAANKGEDGKDGADGKDGVDGKDGLTPFIGENGNWWIGETDTGVRAEGKDGAAANKGEDGEDGKDGLTPFIGENGTWWIGTEDTGIMAAGQSPRIGYNDNWWIYVAGVGFMDSGVKAFGKDGITPTIGENGNWYIGDQDTGVSAGGSGSSGGGQNGLTPHIGTNGNWWIGTEDTGIKAAGTDGKDGVDGKDGEDGKDGVDGKDGEDGKNVEFRVNGTWLQWKYTTDTSWKNLFDLGSLSSGSVSSGLKVSYVLNGGTMPSGTPTEVSVSAGTSVYLPTPSKSGYEFNGWCLSGSSTPVSNPYTVTSNVTLYASWTEEVSIYGTPIYTIDDLVGISNDLYGTYVLMNNINCEGLAIPTIGPNSSNSFCGVFDGNGYTISNYTASTGTYVGLFGYNSGTIKNLQVSDFNLTITNCSSSTFYIGGLVGYNAGAISNCFVSNGYIDVKLKIDRYGGLITAYNNGTISNCIATGSITISQSSENIEYARAAGIAAINNGKINNCLVDAFIKAYSYEKFQYTGGSASTGYAGGITSLNKSSGSIQNCIISGTVQGNYRVGDISVVSEGTISNCYRNENLVISSTTYLYASATAISTINSSSFYRISLGWDSDIWDWSNVDIASGKYPKLKVIR